ncbi:hypothetical protein [Halegenticoccus soli]|uniref:hypothetical protein n=1 Tax=Halegenticoccus soli TaxID=1985678 RepID=UPI000C6CC0F5|nr:hypothetical protein [Halegenticoccus soli]
MTSGRARVGRAAARIRGYLRAPRFRLGGGSRSASSDDASSDLGWFCRVCGSVFEGRPPACAECGSRQIEGDADVAADPAVAAQ